MVTGMDGLDFPEAQGKTVTTKEPERSARVWKIGPGFMEQRLIG